MVEVTERPNTLKLFKVRPADQPETPFRPAIIYVDHIVVVVEETSDTTRLSLANGKDLIVDLSLDKFALRQKIDNPNV
ncbi:MAG: hypothetical protein AAFV54_07160 [Pseudomonadota bacterium]